MTCPACVYGPVHCSYSQCVCTMMHRYVGTHTEAAGGPDHVAICSKCVFQAQQ